MDIYFINTGTVTNASKARDLLRSRGISAYVQASGGNLSAAGCGYGIVVGAGSLEQAKKILKTSGIAVVSITPAKK